MFVLFVLCIFIIYNFCVISVCILIYIKGYVNYLKNLKFFRGNYQIKLDSFFSFMILVSKLSDFQQNINCYLNLQLLVVSLQCELFYFVVVISVKNIYLVCNKCLVISNRRQERRLSVFRGKMKLLLYCGGQMKILQLLWFVVVDVFFCDRILMYMLFF